MNKLSNMCFGIWAICLMIVGMASCVDDEIASQRAVVEGQPIKVSMNFSFNPGKDVVVTRAEDVNTYAGLTNLMIFIYSSKGEFQKVVNSADGTLAYGTSETVTGGVRRNDVVFETTSGTKNILAVANYESGWWDNLSALATQAASLDFEEMKARIISLQYSDEMQPITITGSSQMLMTGWNQGVVFDASGEVADYGERGDDSQQVAIKLDRSLAHITFNIEAEPTDANGTFAPTSYRVYNVPVSSYLTNTDKRAVPASGADNAFSFINYTSANVGSLDEGNYSFDFYMPENIYAENRSVTDYDLRDQWTNGDEDKNTLPEDKKWQYAPETSTFVVISGTYTGTGANGQGSYTGNVTYTVHLGDFSKDDSQGDFSVERNCSYIYNMRVLGVDKIVVEAKREEDGYQQGAEGDIFDYSDCEYTYSLDAHYEQVYLQYNLSQIAGVIPDGLSGAELDNAIADQLILVIQSEAMDYNYSGDDDSYTVQNKRGMLKPYRIYSNAARAGQDVENAKEAVLEGAGTGIRPTKGFDYRWVEFWPQEEHERIAVYPGVSEWSKEDLTGMDNTGVYGGDARGENNRLLDVYDVIVGIGNAVKSIYNDESPYTNGSYNDDGLIITRSGNYGNYTYYARFTAFVNENYYYKHPLTHDDIDTWNVMTNKIPREMIIAMSTDVSADGNNSYSKLYSYISQLSMQTFYNSREESINAFGIESYNETPSFAWGSPRSTNGLDDTDGRGNQMTLINVGNYSNPDWSSYIGYNSSYNPEYTYNGWMNGTPQNHKLGQNAYASNRHAAYAACMSRNRDLNGDGKIQPNEVRWYLPSLNEYIRMSIGTNAVSNAARLYSGDKSKMTREGYPDNYINEGSLYYTSSEDGKRIYWAVERGSYGGNETYSSNPPIRCVRLLPGIEAGQDLTTMEDIQAESTFRSYKVNGMNVLDFRNILDGSLYRERVNDLEIHNEDEASNRFYEGIFVASEYLEDSYKLGDIVGADGTYTWVDDEWPYEQHSLTFNGIKKNPCSGHTEGGYTNWRVPNLVELSAMNAAGFLSGSDKPGEVACCTQFSNMDVRYGFARSSLVYCPGGNGAKDMNTDFYIRCVRDVPEGFNFGGN